MDTTIIISGAIAVILIILIIKFAKSVFKIGLIIILIAVVGFYGFLHFNKITGIEDLNTKYCKDTSDEKDSLKCVCIVQPIENDLKTRFTKEEMEQMGRIEFVKELSVSLFNKRSEITTKLKKNKAESLLDEFTKDYL